MWCDPELLCTPASRREAGLDPQQVELTALAPCRCRGVCRILGPRISVSHPRKEGGLSYPHTPIVGRGAGISVPFFQMAHLWPTLGAHLGSKGGGGVQGLAARDLALPCTPGHLCSSF